MEVSFHELGSIDENAVSFVVIASRYRGKWILVRRKDRSTWEIPGGHREAGEDLELAARRELYEETGVRECELAPVCLYTVRDWERTSLGKLYFAEVKAIGRLPDSEIGEVRSAEDLSGLNLTYPAIQPMLHRRVLRFLGAKGRRMNLPGLSTIWAAVALR